MKKKFLLNIGSGYYQLPIIKTAKELGYKVISTDINKNSPGIKLADIKIIANSHKIYDVEKKIKKYKKRLAGVLTGAARKSILTTSMIAKKEKLIHLNSYVAKQIINKNTISKKFNKKINIPINDLNYIYKNKKIKKIVVKSDIISGQDGVKIFDNSKKNQQEIQKFCKKFNSKILSAEKFITAKHFVVTGLAVKKKYSIYVILYKEVDKNLKTISLNTKNILIDKNKLKIQKYVYSVLKRIKFDNGPFQLEIFMDKDKNYYVGEIEASITGSYISEKIIPYSTGKNFIKDCIKSLTDKKFQLSKIIKINDVKLVFKIKNNIKKHYDYEKLKYAFIKKAKTINDIQ